MPISLDVKIDTKAIERELAAAPKQIRFAIARTLTRTAQQASADIRATMVKVFDRPTPFTLKAFYAKPARTSDLTAWVGSREFAPKGRPASKYLAPEIEGGTRAMKGIEKALVTLSRGQYILPGKGARMDAYGNISRGQLVQILSRLSLMQDATANVSAKTQKRLRKQGLLTAASRMQSEYFVAKDRASGRPLGIWQLVARGKVVPVLIFTTKPPHYAARLPFGNIVRESLAKNWERIGQEEVANALATARLT